MAKDIFIDDRKLQERLKRMQSRLNNGSPIMRKISAVYMYKDIIDHFQKQKGPKSKWKSIRRGGAILQDTGRLRNSIRPRSTKKEAIVGTNVIYAAIHNEGKGSMPKREFMYLSPKSIKVITKALGKFFITGK